jgi:hypothetical protein
VGRERAGRGHHRTTTPDHAHESKARGFRLLAKPIAPAKLQALIDHEMASSARNAKQLQ